MNDNDVYIVIIVHWDPKLTTRNKYKHYKRISLERSENLRKKASEMGSLVHIGHFKNKIQHIFRPPRSVKVCAV